MDIIFNPIAIPFALVGFLLFVVMLVFLLDKSPNRDLLKEYEEALDRLANNTTKANRIAALDAGRRLARSRRRRGALTIFDEIYILNDLEARCVRDGMDF